MEKMTMTQCREALHAAFASNEPEKVTNALEQMSQTIAADVASQFAESRSAADVQVLTARGVRQLTSKEREYYQSVLAAMRSETPKQALANVGVAFTPTIIDAVFDDITKEHPLLDAIRFERTGGAIKMLVNTHGEQRAVWGKLCAEIVKEIESGFKEIDTGLLKLSAFIPVCKAQLELGPEWLDLYVRRILVEALANGMEYGVVNGDGNDSPIGMIRQVGDDVSVVGGAYPAKSEISVSDFSPATVGNLISLMAADGAGKSRPVDGLILLVNPVDYFRRIMPATTVMAPDGTYRNDVLPYPIRVIQSTAVSLGKAVFGLGRKYAAFAGMQIGGRIEYSDEYQFLEDNRVYLIKLYANGFPMDNNAFLYLDISGIEPIQYKVVAVDARTPSSDADLSALSLGTAALSPAFDADEDTYTATTTNASNTINAVPSDAGATIVITLNGAVVENGSALTWTAGSNTVLVVVAAEDGTTSQTYTITVTKS